SALGHPNAALYCGDSLQNRLHVMPGIGGRDYASDQHHDQRRPFEHDRSQVLQRAVRTEHIEKDFMNNHEAQDQVDCRAAPVEIEVGWIPLLVTSPGVEGKQDTKAQNLKRDVGEKGGKNLIEFSS